MDYIIILILLVIFVYCHFYTHEEYVVLSNNKLIPNDMLTYQKNNKKNKNYGFIPRSLYPDILAFNDNCLKKVIKEFKLNNGKEIFNDINTINGCKFYSLIKNKKILSNKFPYLLKKLKHIKNLENATLSCLNANHSTTIHNQFDSKLFRAHIPIQIPKDKCGICVENQCRTWKYGSYLLVDENLMHKVWNDSNLDRIILLLDVQKVQIN